jgi:hypothetical protein
VKENSQLDDLREEINSTRPNLGSAAYCRMAVGANETHHAGAPSKQSSVHSPQDNGKDMEIDGRRQSGNLKTSNEIGALPRRRGEAGLIMNEGKPECHQYSEE